MRWQNVMVLTDKPGAKQALALLNRHSEAAVRTSNLPSEIDVTEEVLDKWNQGTIEAFAMGDNSYFPVELSKAAMCRHTAFEHDLMMRFFDVETVAGRIAYDADKLPVAVTEQTSFSVSELFVRCEFGYHYYIVPYSKPIKITKQLPSAVKFSVCQWAAADAYAVPEIERTPAEKAACVPLDELVEEALALPYTFENRKTGEEFEFSFDELCHKFENVQSLTPDEWNHFHYAIAAGNNTVSAAASFFLTPTPAIVNVDGTWHDALSDTGGDENKWAANFYSNFIIPNKGQELWVSEFMVEDF